MNHTNDTREVMRPEAAAGYIDCAKRTLDDWRVTGGGPKYIKLSHRMVRYRRADLDAWLEQHALTSTSAESAT